MGRERQDCGLAYRWLITADIGLPNWGLLHVSGHTRSGGRPGPLHVNHGHQQKQAYIASALSTLVSGETLSYWV